MNLHIWMDFEKKQEKGKRGHALWSEMVFIKKYF